MPFTRLDATRQIKQGEAFALPLAAGGLGRTDGIGRGTIVRVGNPQPLAGSYTAATIPAGAPVKPAPVNMYGPMAVQATTEGDDSPIGVALVEIPVGGTGFVMVNGYATVLVTGTAEPGDTLYASATDGTASTSSGGGGSLGHAVTEAAAGSCLALIQPGGVAGTAGLQAVATIVVPGSYHSGAIQSNDQDTDGWDGSIPAGLVGKYALGFDFMQAAQHPLESFRWWRQTGGSAFEDFSSVVSDAAAGSWRMQAMELVDPDADIDASSEWTINHSSDGWSIHCALLFTGVSARIGQATANGTGTSAGLSIATEPGDLVVACVAMNIASETITDGAGQTRRQTGSGGFVGRLMAASTKLATASSTSVSFSWTTSGEYSLIVIVLRGGVTVGDGHVDVVGTEATYARWPHAHHVFRAYAPGVNDDEDWYPEGTSWTDTSSGRTYVLTDGTIGAAVWLEWGTGNPMTAAGDLVYGGASGVATRLPIGTAGYEMTARAGAPAWEAKRASLIAFFSPAEMGAYQDLVVDFACEIESATLLADQAGDVVIDIWKDSYANYPPTVADSITASAKPTLSGAIKSQDSTLTGWTKTITAGQTLRFVIDSAATLNQVTLILKLRRT